MEKKRNKIQRSVLKIVALCFMLIYAFSLASCTQSSPKHTCQYGGTSVETDTLTRFETSVESSTGLTLQYYYLDSNITLSDPLKIPNGHYVGLCLATHSISVKNSAPLYVLVDSSGNVLPEGEGEGGLFTYKCGTHGAHGGHTFYYVDQGFIDLAARAGINLYEKFSLNNMLVDNTLCLSLRAGVNDEVLTYNVGYESLKAPEGYRLIICTNDQNLTGDAILHDSDGQYIRINCRSSTYHECIHLDDLVNTVYQDNLLSVYNNLQKMTPGSVYQAYLLEDVTWMYPDVEFKVPDGVVFNLCLNGFSANIPITTSTESNDGSTKPGEVHIFECANHYCDNINDTGTMYAINKRSYNWTMSLFNLIAASNTDSKSLTKVYCVLEDNIDVAVVDGLEIWVCVNGYQNKDAVIEDGGRVIYYNCCSAHSCSVPTFLPQIPGVNQVSLPAFVKTAEDLQLVINDLPEGLHFLNLTSDVTGEGKISAKGGVIVGICRDHHTFDEEITFSENIFVYNCSTQYCDVAKAKVPSFDDDVIKFWQALAGEDTIEVTGNYVFALSENMTIPAGLIGLSDGASIEICMCGHTLTSSAVLSGVALHTGCESALVSDSHSCSVESLLNGVTAKPIYANNIAELNTFLAGEKDGGVYYLTSNITGVGEIVAPGTGLFGICTCGFTVSEDITAPDGVFLYQCGSKICTVIEERIPVFDQGIVDYFSAVVGDAYLPITENFAFAISEDVVLDFNIHVADGAILNVCSCGHSATGLSSISGVRAHHDYKVADAEHECMAVSLIPEDSGILVQPMISNRLDAINMGLLMLSASVGSDEIIPILTYLTDNIIGDGELVIPENIILGICLNGYSLGNVTISSPNVLIYDCDTRYCEELDAYLPAFDQGFFTFLQYLNSTNADEDGNVPPIFIGDVFAFVALGDVHIPEGLFAVSDGAVVGACTCGYNVTGLENIQVVSNEEYNVVETESGSESTPAISQLLIHDTCPQRTALPIEVEPHGCAVCGREEDYTTPLNFATWNAMIDEEGNVTLPAGSYYYYLENDFQLTRMLIVPEGVDLHICLNGHRLYSAYLWYDSQTFGGGYPEKSNMGFATVSPNATLNIYDCSEDHSGEVALRHFRKKINGISTVISTVADENDALAGTSDGSISIGSLISYFATNSGTINVFGGNLYSAIGIVNVGNGAFNLYNGQLTTTSLGVLNLALDISEGLETSGLPGAASVNIGEGGTLSSGAIALLSLGGSAELNGGSINAGLMGIVTYPIAPELTCSMTLNDGEINIAYLPQISATMQSVSSAMGVVHVDDPVLDIITLLNGDIGVATAVLAYGSLEIQEDIDINIADTSIISSLPIVSELFVISGTQVEVDAEVENEYQLLADGPVNVGKTDKIIPANGCDRYVNRDGEMVIMPSGVMDSIIKVEGVSASTSGSMSMNFYATMTADLEDRVVLYAEYKGNVIAYTCEDAQRSYDVNGNVTLKYSLGISAKDYAENIRYYFVVSPLTDEQIASGVTDDYADLVDIHIGEGNTSLKIYLDHIIANAETYGSLTAQFAQAMDNYCAAAAKQFGTASSYTPSIEGMDLVTVDVLDSFKPTKSVSGAPKTALAGTTVLLQSETAFRVYFTVNTYTDESGVAHPYFTDGVADHVIATVDGVPVEIKESGVASRPYYIEVNGISAKRLGDTFDIVVADIDDPDNSWSVQYSVMSYAYSAVKNPAAYGTDTVNATKALCLYYYTALQYFGCTHSADDAYSADCDTTCNYCGRTRSTSQYHTYTSATCTTPATCVDCGYENGDPLGHSYDSADDTTCSVCGKSESNESDGAEGGNQ